MTVDAVDVVLEEHIAAAKQALVDFSIAQPAEWWTAFDLKARARNGWSGGVMALALYELLDENRFERGVDLRIRVRPNP